MINSQGPDFIGIGAPRAGTTWIHNCLYEHPEIYSPTKEVLFFSEEFLWQRGRDWYEDIFKDCPPGKKGGEISNSYLKSAVAPGRIAALYPKVKLIACLRHPVERAFSNYLFDLKFGFVKNQSFSEALRENPHYLQYGCYATSLRNYFKYFSREQLLIVIYEEIAPDPAAFIKKIYQFIGVNSHFIPSVINQRFNQSRTLLPWFINRSALELAAFIRRKRFHRLRWFLIKSGGEQLFSANKPGKEIPAADRKWLLDFYKEEIRGVEEILGRKVWSITS